MSRIKISNFGPVNESSPKTRGWLDIKKVTVFTGNQGSGKSTVAKLISTFSWIEKVLVRGDYGESGFSAEKFRTINCAYQRIEHYFKEGRTEIIYDGDAYKLTYTRDNKFIINRKQNPLMVYPLPQIMYVPAERNLVSVVNKASLLKDLPDSLLDFIDEYDKAKQLIYSGLELPINDASIKYDKTKDIVYVTGSDYNIRLDEASSGFQSLVPLYLVSRSLSESVSDQANSSRKMSSFEAKLFETAVAEIWANKDLNESQRRIALSALSARFNKTAFINIVEEPEQNLYPESQWKIVSRLLAFNNSLPGNKLIITTHSPYLINWLTVAIKAGTLLSSENISDEIRHRIDSVIPTDAAIHSNDIAVYECNEKEGTVTALDTYKGLPSDENYLNQLLERTNDDFAELLDIQDELDSGRDML